jgi:hypothetical protein
LYDVENWRSLQMKRLFSHLQAPSTGGVAPILTLPTG